MEELTREEVVKLAFDAGFGRHEVMNSITRFERFVRLVQDVDKEDEGD
jgi:hypothetical protein